MTNDQDMTVVRCLFSVCRHLDRRRNPLAFWSAARLQRGGCGTSVLPGLSAALNCTNFSALKPMGVMCLMRLRRPELVTRAQSKAALRNRIALARIRHSLDAPHSKT